MAQKVILDGRLPLRGMYFNIRGKSACIDEKHVSFVTRGRADSVSCSQRHIVAFFKNSACTEASWRRRLPQPLLISVGQICVRMRRLPTVYEPEYHTLGTSFSNADFQSSLL
jgi:hypothetical protein